MGERGKGGKGREGGGTKHAGKGRNEEETLGRERDEGKKGEGWRTGHAGRGQREWSGR